MEEELTRFPGEQSTLNILTFHTAFKANLHKELCVHKITASCRYRWQCFILANAVMSTSRMLTIVPGII